MLGIDSLITGDAPEPGAPRARARASSSARGTSATPLHVDGARRRGPRLRLARLADRLPEASVRDAPRRVDRSRERAAAREGEGRAVRAVVHLGGVRRSARAPAAGELLGKREPGRSARGVRRGEAVRGGDHGRVPAVRARRDPHRADLQHLRPADAARRRPGRPDARRAGAARRAAHGLRRRAADAELLLRRRQRGGDLAAPPLGRDRPGEHREPARDDDPRVRAGGAARGRLALPDRAPAAAAGRSRA